MAITPGPGYMVDPNNPNGVIPIGSAAQAQHLGVNNTGATPSANISYGAVNTNPAPTSGMITRTSSAPSSPSSSSNTTSGMLPAQNTAQTPPPTQYNYINGQAVPATSNTNTQSSTQTPPSTDTNQTPPAPKNTDATRTGLIQSQANTAQTDPTQTPAYQEALTTYNTAQKAYQDLQLKIANTEGALETGDQALPVVLGQEGALQKQLAAQLDAYSNTMQAAQAKMQTAVTGYSAQTSAQNAVTTQTQPGSQYIQQGPANTIVGANGQPVNQTGGTAGSLISPMSGMSLTSTGNPQADTAVMTALQQVKNGMAPSDAVSLNQLSLYGSKATSMFGSGLPGGYNVNTANAAAEASASNTTTAGTASNTAWNTVYQTHNTNAGNFTTALNTINPLGTDTLKLMNSMPTTALQDPKFLAAPLNSLATQFQDPTYAQFNAQVAGLQRAISNYLQLGEIPTSATQGAQAIADGSITVGSLAGALQGINTDITDAINAENESTAYAKSQLGNVPASSGSNTSGSFTTGQTAAGGTLTWNGSAWVPTK